MTSVEVSRSQVRSTLHKYEAPTPATITLEGSVQPVLSQRNVSVLSPTVINVKGKSALNTCTYSHKDLHFDYRDCLVPSELPRRLDHPGGVDGGSAARLYARAPAAPLDARTAPAPVAYAEVCPQGPWFRHVMAAHSQPPTASGTASWPGARTRMDTPSWPSSIPHCRPKGVTFGQAAIFA